MIKNKTFFKMGILSAGFLLVGCNNIDKDKITEEQSISKKEPTIEKSTLELVNREDNIIHYKINKELLLKNINWEKVNTIFNIDTNKFKKDFFKLDYISGNTNIEEKNTLEYSYELIKNDDLGVFLGQEKDTDKWSIKIGANNINDEYISNYLKPMIDSIYADTELSVIICDTVNNILNEINNGYDFGIIELSNDMSININKKETINTTTMYDLPNVYTYNIELKY